MQVPYLLYISDTYTCNTFIVGDTSDPDMEVIPGPSDVGNAKTIVYYDLETTGLSMSKFVH